MKKFISIAFVLCFVFQACDKNTLDDLELEAKADVNHSSARWVQKADIPTNSGYYDGLSFAIESKVYMGAGNNEGGDIGGAFFEYDPSTNSWSQKATYIGGAAPSELVSFSIGNKGYAGLGGNYSSGYLYSSNFNEYDPSTNTWKRIAPFPGGGRRGAIGLSINGKGYVGTGKEPIYIDADGEVSPQPQSTRTHKDWWEYNPKTDCWTRKADLCGGVRLDAAGFVIGKSGYIATGNDTQEFLEYNPATNKWKKRANFPGAPRRNAIGFAVNGKGYMGTGGTDYPLYEDMWEYDPLTDKWLQIEDYPEGRTQGVMAATVGNKVYTKTGETDLSESKQLWEFDPIR